MSETVTTYDDLSQVAGSVSAMAAACVISTVYSTSDIFFATVPTQYQPFYFLVVRRCQQFYDGFVPELHGTTQWVFSTRLAAALCGGVANKIVGPKVGFRAGAGTSDYETVSWLSHQWAEQVDFSTFLRQATEYAAALSTSLMKINRDQNGVYYPQAVRMDDFTFTADARNELVEAKCLVKAYESTMPLDEKKARGDGAQGDTYFLVERRFFQGAVGVFKWRDQKGREYRVPDDQRVPMCEYQVIKVPVAYGVAQHVLSTGRAAEVGWDELPEDVQKSINKEYGFARVGVPFRLPFATGCLGAWLLPFNGFDGSVPNFPVGKALTRDIFVELAEYDIYESFKNVDVHNGKGQVLTPKSQSMEDVLPAYAVNVAGVMEMRSSASQPGGSPFAPRASNIETLPGQSPDQMKPIVNQFSLRAQDWQTLQDGTLRSIASKIHMSPKVISQALAASQAGGQKTATEVDSDDDSTIDMITLHRGIIAKQVNKLIECVLSCTGHVGNAEVVFGNVGLRSKDKAIDYISKALQAHVITRADAIRELNPELDEEQLQKKIAECQAEEQSDRENETNFPLGAMQGGN